MLKNTYDYGDKQLKESNQVKLSLKFNPRDKISNIRDAYAYHLRKIILKNKKFVLIDADLGTVAKTLDFKKNLNLVIFKLVLRNKMELEFLLALHNLEKSQFFKVYQSF